jgi:hypothetical protein
LGARRPLQLIHGICGVFGSFVTKDRARELHGQNSEFVHSKINLEEQVEKMFLEEYTAQ